MGEYVSVEEASALVEQTEQIINRFIRKVLLDNDPDHAKKIKLGKSERGFHYTIEKQFLLDQFKLMTEQGDNSILAKEYTGSMSPPAVKPGKSGPIHRPGPAAILPNIPAVSDNELIAAFIEQLHQKDNCINELLARIKEMNEIIRALQQHISAGEMRNKQNQKTVEIDLEAQDVTRILDQDLERPDS
ncbi:hypothetical protein JXQ70_04490 [bacterium]|nr:hypothetical protein [bacterium]